MRTALQCAMGSAQYRIGGADESTAAVTFVLRRRPRFGRWVLAPGYSGRKQEATPMDFEALYANHVHYVITTLARRGVAPTWPSSSSDQHVPSTNATVLRPTRFITSSFSLEKQGR